MIFVTNSTDTQAIGIGTTASVVALTIQASEHELSLHVRVDGINQPDFETSQSLDDLKAKAAAIMGALS